MEPKTYDRPDASIAIWVGSRLRWPINRFLARQSLIGTEPFFDESQVPGIGILRENWEVISDEARTVLAERDKVPSLGEISPDHRRIAHDAAWKSFFFTGYGYKVRANRAKCPRTAALIDRVPNVMVAFYSIFEGGTHVPEHHGVTKAMLNVHLALAVPAGPERCEIRVGDSFRGWTPGEFLIFDETFAHEAWNQSSEPRVVLFLQVLRPMAWRGRLLGKLFLWCLKRTQFVQDVRKAIQAT